MVLLKRLLLLLSTVAFSDGALCPSAFFNDVTGNAKSDCVNGNFHLSCPTGAPVTVYINDIGTSFDDLVAIGGTWFGLKCGSDAVLLDTTPSLSCPETPCVNNCPFVNSGGVEPKNTCKNGNQLKTCPDGSLFLGNEAFSNAACTVNGKWVAWSCGGDVEVIDGTLEASCSPSQCVDPVWLRPEDNNYTDFMVDTSQRATTTFNGVTRFSCKSDSGAVFIDSGKMFWSNTNSATLQCNSGDGKWMISPNDQDWYAYNGTAFGCVKPNSAVCLDSTFLDGTEAALASLSSILVKAEPLIIDDGYFRHSCPTGSSLAYLDGNALVPVPFEALYCYENGYFGRNATSDSNPLPPFKYGCFAPRCSNSITYMKQSQLNSSLTGVIVDTSQTDVFINGEQELRCAAGTQLGYLNGGIVVAYSKEYLGCTGAGGWKVKKDGSADVVYSTTVAVGCIKPTCTGMRLFDGSETFLSSLPQYEFVVAFPSYSNNKWELFCPAGSSIGYADQPATFQFDVTLKISCDAAGWWVKTSSNTAGYALASTKVGCFKKTVLPTVPTPTTCPTLSYLPASSVASYTGITVDVAQTAVIVGGINQLKCAAGTQFAFLSNSLIYTFDWWLTCAGAASGGWRIKDAAGQDSVYAGEVVGCIKSTCTGLQFFDGSEALLTLNPLYELIPTVPKYSSSGRFELACPSDCSIGKDDEGSFSFDTTIKITCESGGWWVKSSSNYAGSLIAPTKYGCFRKWPNCPAPNMINQTQLTSYVGVSVDTTQGVVAYSSGLNSLKCSKPGTYLAQLLPSLHLVNWYLACDNVAQDGWRVKDTSGNNGIYDGSAVACIKPTCTGMLTFDGNEALLISNPSYQFVATVPSYKDGRFELVCPTDCGIGYAENATKFTYESTMKITCESAGWWMKTATNINGVALSPVKFGCFRKLYVPTTNCPAPVLLTPTLISAWVGVSVDTTQTSVVVVNGFNQLKCSGSSLFAFIATPGPVFTRQNWWITCNDAVTALWRVRDATGKNDNYGKTVPVGCVKPTCGDLPMFDGSEYVLGSYSTYQVVATQPSLVTGGRFTLACPAGSSFGYAATATTITLGSTLGITSITCEAAGWWVKTTANPTGQLLSVIVSASAKVGCFKTITAPVLPAQCQTGINYFEGNEKILRDNSDYACTGDKAAAVNGQWKLNCPTGASVGYAETSTKFTFATGMNIFCNATGWIATTSDNPTGSALAPVKVGCFMPVTCPKTALLQFTGLETMLTSQSTYTFTGDAIKWKNGVAQLSCPVGGGIGFAQTSTTFKYDATMRVTCQGTEWWMNTENNGAGVALPASRVGCFNPFVQPNCSEILVYDEAACTAKIRTLDASWLPTDSCKATTITKTTITCATDPMFPVLFIAGIGAKNGAAIASISCDPIAMEWGMKGLQGQILTKEDILGAVGTPPFKVACAPKRIDWSGK